MRNKGSILIIVLWSLFILGALAVAISGYVSGRISVAAKLSQRARGYYLAKAGIARAILEVKNDTTEKYDSLNDNWSTNDAAFKEVKLGDGTYSVFPLLQTPLKKEAAQSEVKPAVRYGLSDEESKLNINKASKDVLKKLLLITCEIDPDKAGAIAASIVNWRSPADRADKEGASAFYYQSLDRPYNCRNAPIEAPEELLLVRDMTPDIFGKIKSYITIYGSGAVNINTADAAVLSSIGMGDELARKVAGFRSLKSEGGKDGADVTAFDDLGQVTALLVKKESISAEESAKISALIGSGQLTVNSDNFGGIAVGNAGGQAGASIAFVFDRKNNAMRYWKE